MTRLLLTLLLSLGLVGCNNPTSFSNKCYIEKVDGKVVNVKIILPNGNLSSERQASYEIRDREDMDKLIDNMESLLLDLKIARDQMKVAE